jgi:hypothetical protein
MRKKYIGILIAAIILLIGLLIYMNIRQKRLDQRPFKIYEYPSTLKVSNGTDWPKADTIILSLAYHIFHIDTGEIILAYIPNHMNSGDMEFYGIVQQIPFDKKKFLILVNRNLDLNKLFITLSHEFVHIHQYSRGDLSVFGHRAIWKGDTLNLLDIKYDDRPFEQEAFSKQASVNSKIKKILYE